MATCNYSKLLNGKSLLVLGLAISLGIVFIASPAYCWSYFKPYRSWMDHDKDGHASASQWWNEWSSTGHIIKVYGDDCDDNNPDIYPGHPEVCGDGLDNNCNGQIDEGCSTTSPPPSTTPPTSSSGDVSQVPLFLSESAKPMLMLDMSKDSQLYFSAYNDYTDLDGDGIPDRTYKNSIDYYGYFDSYKCYDYNTSSGQFEPVSTTSDKYCSGYWSGNFLNWASMARIDTVRKILYGGLRSTDTSSSTVLERTYLPNDAHAWVRYYDGSDISKLTPFNPPTTLLTGTSTSNIKITTGSINLNFSKTSFSSGDIVVGDQVTMTQTVDPTTTGYMMGVVTGYSGGNLTLDVGKAVGSGTYAQWDIVDPSRQGISICNTTVASSGYSQNVTAPPLLRVASGNYNLWTANERWQCRWHEEVSASSNQNQNKEWITGLEANALNPTKSTVGLGQNDYIVRVKACVPGLIGNEECKEYPNGDFKPVGLLQTYGDDEHIYFGLMTGSYEKNKSGGVLRKNIGSMHDEINWDTDGTFKSPPSAGSIIDSLDKLRIYGYNHSDGTYNTGDNCTWGISSFNNGSCTNWGNPQSEIFLESLRYLAGLSPESAFSFSGDDKITGLKCATWKDPITNQNYCAPLNIIDFNASMASYDDDQLSGAGDLPGAPSASAWTDKVGAGEGINGNDWFVGSNGVDNNQLCTSKTVNSLGAINGICPEAPRLDGSYDIAGLAYYAYTNSIRTGFKSKQYVKTYGVSLAPAVPRIEIPLPGQSQTAVTILPACRDSTVGGNCSIDNFKIVSQDTQAGTGSFFIQWDDSEQGGDFDQDMAGVLSYVITNSNITVTTQVLAQSTPYSMGFGYVISGTDHDGFHSHSGINSFNFADPTAVKGCGNCTSGDPATSVTYGLTGTVAKSLQQPLYYAAKWGGYDKNNPNFPTDPLSWDKDGDSIPDNYFYATNPSKLDTSLNQVFYQVAQATAAAAAVASNSTSLGTDTILYQATFYSGDWSGDLTAYHVDPVNGALGAKVWQAQKNLPAASSRAIYTFDPAQGTGIPFLWADLSSAQKASLNIDPETGLTDTNGQIRLDYVRGDQSNEVQNRGSLRNRTSVMGDIIDSDPLFVGTSDYGYSQLPGTEGTDYTNFRASSSYNNRTLMLYVGGNDGMLHAIDAATGREKFAYVPNAVIPNLNLLTDKNYTHHFYVDGSPHAGDAYVNGQWGTYLVGSLAGGGQAIYGLNITDPDTFASADVLWELTPDTTDTSGGKPFADLGYSFSEPTIIRLANGQWGAVFGNGYDSTNGHAVLYIVSLADGSLIKAFDTGVGTASTPDGLSSPLPVDLNGDRITDVIYAGDLYGNMWKFDVSNQQVSKWNIAFNGAPFFQARDSANNPQPITSRPIIGLNDIGGYMIYFGTGKFFEKDDNIVPANPPVNSFYGIRDNGAAITATDRSTLQAQAITGEPTVNGTKYRLTEQNPVNWSTQDGWYMDLVSPVDGKQGERVVSTPLLRNGRIIFATMIPSPSPCDYGGTSWLMELDAMTGGRLDYTPYDVNGDKTFDSSDYVTTTDSNGQTQTIAVSGQGTSQGIFKTPKVVLVPEDSQRKDEVKPITLSDGEIKLLPENQGTNVVWGRRSWQQLQ